MKKFTKLILALAMIVMTVFSVSATSLAASNPYVTGQKVSNISTNTAKFEFTIKNPSRVSVPQCGAQIRPKGGNWTTHTENIVAKHRTLASCPVWYEVGRGKEFNYTLNPNTNYEMRGFCKYGGRTYYTGIVGFRTNPVPTTTNTNNTTTKMNNFINDGRWKNGIAWGDNQRPKLSTYNSQGCCAYAADFVRYVYGNNNARSGTRFTNVSGIKAGDVLQINSSKWGVHWICVLSRSGNSLRVAEGNVLKNGAHVTMVSNGTWVISGNNIYSNYAKCTYTLTNGYHH